MSIDKTSETPEDHIVENPEAAAKAVTAVDPRLLVREQGFAGYASEFKRKMKAGDLGSIPVVLGLIIIWIIFQSLNSNFLTAGNLSDISVAMVGTGMIAVGIVFVLLLGEIDLSVGSVSGVAGAAFAVLNVTHGMNEWLAFVLAILTGTVMRRAPRFRLRAHRCAGLRRHPGGSAVLERLHAPDPRQQRHHQPGQQRPRRQSDQLLLH